MRFTDFSQREFLCRLTGEEFWSGTSVIARTHSDAAERWVCEQIEDGELEVYPCAFCRIDVCVDKEDSEVKTFSVHVEAHTTLKACSAEVTSTQEAANV